MKYFITLLVFLSSGLMIYGFSLDENQEDLANKYIGSGTVLLFLIAMPLFLIKESKGKKMNDYMLTEENVRKMQAGRKLPKGKREPSKPAMPFNKGGMVKKNHAKPGSYSKAYMKGGMATDMRKTGMFKGGYSTKKK